MADDPGDVIVITSITTRLKAVAAGREVEIYKRVTDFHSALNKEFSGTSDAELAPAPAAPRRWKVNVSSASLWKDQTKAMRLGYANQGEVLDEIESQPGWVHTSRGWILSVQVEAI